MSYSDKEKQREASRKHYLKNRVALIARATKFTREVARPRLRQVIADHLSSNHCIDCGEDDPVVLDFDHRDDKRFNIGDAAKKKVSVKTLLAEIAKCDVRCANCHRRKTHRERQESVFWCGVEKVDISPAS